MIHKIMIAILIAISLGSVQKKEEDRRSVSVTVDFRAEIIDTTGLRFELEPLWGDTYRLTYQAHRSGLDSWQETGEALLIGRGQAMIAVMDRVEIQTPEAIAVLPIRRSWRLASGGPR